MKILKSIENIDDELITRAEPTGQTRVRFTARLKWALPLAACLAVAIYFAMPLLNTQPTDGAADTDGASDILAGQADNAADSLETEAGTGGALISVGTDAEPENWQKIPSDERVMLPAPPLKIDPSIMYEACYIALEDWRGLPASGNVLNEKWGDTGTAAADRLAFTDLDILIKTADAFVLTANVIEIAAEGDNMQTALVEYIPLAAGNLDTSEWNDITVSTGNQVLIRQYLIGGCAMDEASNLLRAGGIYVLPLRFQPGYSAYEVVGDFDVLFELDDEGKMFSHSSYPELNKYDGYTLPEFISTLEAATGEKPSLRATPTPINEPVEPAAAASPNVFAAPNRLPGEPQERLGETYISIISQEDAYNLLTETYAIQGLGAVKAEFRAITTLWEKIDAYLFEVTLPDGTDEYGAISVNAGAFIRLNKLADGGFEAIAGIAAAEGSGEVRE
ncbi:MAG: hypothetical protein LBM98_01910 [Oscillospiraceae bacterium]|jgi:hypothetical protein|nr:hypothetical protein [Oscillospiraceae bacterium]